NNQRKEEGEEGHEWVIKSKFEDELSGFMLEKSFDTKGLGEMLDQHRKGMHEQFSQTLIAIGGRKNPTPKPDASIFAITTRLGTSTRDPPYPTPPSPTVDHSKGAIEKGPVGEEPTVTRNEEAPQSPTFYHPSKSSSVPFPSRLKKQKKEKLEKVASLVKLSEECSAVIQRSLPQKKGDIGSFTLPCLIGPLAVKNALADLGASINLMPHSLFLRLSISELKPTRISIQLVDRSIKYPLGVCENLLVTINKFIFSVDFVVLEMDEHELVPIILGRPFLTTARAVIDVHERKLSLRV
ncbi:putative reverse transcriptase domain-containing protein, partial [Tanacetum coccineum]